MSLNQVVWNPAPAEEEEEGGQEGKVAPEGGALQGDGFQDGLQPLQQTLLGFLHLVAQLSFQYDFGWQ